MDQEQSTDPEAKPDPAPVPLFIVKENEYYDDYWAILGAFTDKSKALRFIEERERELASKFSMTDDELDNWYTHTIQETFLF